MIILIIIVIIIIIIIITKRVTGFWLPKLFLMSRLDKTISKIFMKELKTGKNWSKKAKYKETGNREQ